METVWVCYDCGKRWEPGSGVLVKGCPDCDSHRVANIN